RTEQVFRPTNADSGSGEGSSAPSRSRDCVVEFRPFMRVPSVGPGILPQLGHVGGDARSTKNVTRIPQLQASRIHGTAYSFSGPCPKNRATKPSMRSAS